MMKDDSYNISISFKTNLAQLRMIENTCQSHFMSRSQLIRSGIILMMSKLAKSNTSSTDKMTVASVFDDIPPSVDMFATTSNTVADTASIVDDYPCAPSIYADFQ